MIPDAIGLLDKLLGLLSPDEIAQLTTISQGSSRVPLTQMMLEEQGQISLKAEGEEAKILPFARPEDKSSQAPSNPSEASNPDNVTPFNAQADTQAAPPVAPVSDSNSVQQSASTDEVQAVSVDESEDLVNADTTSSASTSLLILEVKRKLKSAQEKIKEKEVYDLYKKNNLIDIQQEKLNNQSDMKKSSNMGVLVNKKQA